MVVSKFECDGLGQPNATGLVRGLPIDVRHVVQATHVDGVEEAVQADVVEVRVRAPAVNIMVYYNILI